MSTQRKIPAVAGIVACFCASFACAEIPDTFAIKVIGRDQITVTQPQLTIGDVAEVTSNDARFDDAVIGIKRIRLEQSPKPGQDLSLTAISIIDRMRAEGVDLKRVGYSIPRVITVKRAAREVTSDEIVRVLDRFFEKSGRDVSIDRIEFKKPVLIAPGDAQLEVMDSADLRSLTLRAKVEGAPDQEFKVTPTLNEWREVPVATRALAPGAVVQEGDFQRARINLARLPRGAVTSDEQIIGQATQHEVTAGEVFKRDSLSAPVVISKGQKVTLRYRSGLFEATASGIAIEDGATGQDIKIKNDTSNKVVVATVIEPGLAEVGKFVNKSAGAAQ